MSNRVLGEREARAWDAYIRMTHIVTSRIGRDLSRDTVLSVAEHDVLCALGGVAEQRLRLSALSDTMAWELSRLSHQLRRMEKRGLVERHACLDDGRGVEYGLTAEGLAAIQSAGPAHDEAVRRYVTSHLTGEELDTLAGVSEKILQSLQDDNEDT